MTKNQGFQSTHYDTFDEQEIASDGSKNSRGQNSNEQEHSSIQYLSPTLSRLLDVLVSLAQTGPNESPRNYVGRIHPQTFKNYCFLINNTLIMSK